MKNRKILKNAFVSQFKDYFFLFRQMIKARKQLKMGEILTGLVPFFFCITMVNGGMSVVLNQGPLL